MYATNYHRPSSVSEAVALAAGTDAKYLAGGQTLIPAMRLRLAAPSDLVDLRHVEELKGLTIAGREVTIGAATTHAEVMDNTELKAICPALCMLASQIGDPHVRHMGTIGGSIANNDPAADYPAALLALKATIVTDRRQVAADDFFTGLFETALQEGEVITGVRFTAPDSAGYAKFPNPASRFALTGVFVVRHGDSARVAVTGAGEEGVFRAQQLEEALAARFDPGALEGVALPPDGLLEDIHASAAYRANLIVVMAGRAVGAALASN